MAHPDLLVLDEPTVGLDPVLRVDLWERFDDSGPAAAPRCWCPATSWTKPTTASDLLLMRDGRLLAHTTPTRLREDTGCQSLEEAFLSVIRHSTAATQA